MRAVLTHEKDYDALHSTPSLSVVICFPDHFDSLIIEDALSKFVLSSITRLSK